MIINQTVGYSFRRRLIASILLGKWISQKKWLEILQNKIDKGWNKYHILIDDCPKDKYNWEDMFLEEMIDAFVYLEKMKE